MAHNGIPKSPIRPFKGHSGSRASGKKKNWGRNHNAEPLKVRVRTVIRTMFFGRAHA